MPEKNNGAAVKVKGRDDGCCGIDYLRYVLYFFNFILWLSGFAIVGVAVWTILDKHHYVSLLTSGTYATTTYILLGTGGVVIFAGFIGCCGAWRQNRICLMLYACFLLLIFLHEAIAGILAYMYEATVHDELLRSLNMTMLNSYKMDTEKTEAIDHMQQAFQCCGFGSFQDWRYSRWLKGNPNINNTVPDSCCKTMSMACAIRDHPSNIYYDGCVTGLEIYMKRHLIILGAVGLGICCLQIFGIIFACCLAKKIKEWKDRQATLAW